MSSDDIGSVLAKTFGTALVVIVVFALGFWLGGLGRKTPAASVTAAPDKPTERPKYACSMMCVPPLPRPGKCPICGMEMVEVKTDENAEDGDAERQLRLSPRAERLAEIRVAPVERKFVEADVRLVGKVTYDETRVAYITSWIPGRLDRLFVDYTGVAVEKGDRLVYTYSPDLLSAQEELFQAKRAAERLKNSTLPSMRDTAQKMVTAVREKLRLYGLTAQQIAEIELRGTPSDHLTVLAPMSGIVVHKNAREGMYVTTGTRIYTIADLSTVWVKLDVYESDLPWVRYGQEVEFSTEAYPGETFRGKIAFIDPVLDGRTRTIKVRVNVPNAEGRLKPDMFVRAIVRSRVAAGGKVMDASLAGKWISPKHPEIVRDAPGECDVCGVPLVRAEDLGYVAADRARTDAPLVIPRTAPLITGKRAVVYVAVTDKPGLYEGRSIQLGPRAGEYYIVRDGLRENEMVVVNGNFKIDSAIQIRQRPSMMNPEGGGVPGHAHQGGTREKGGAEPKSTGPAVTRESKPPVPPAFRARLGPLFTAYLAVQTALSQDEHATTGAAARELIEAPASIDATELGEGTRARWDRLAAAVRTSASGLAVAGDINEARESFATLSDAMTAIADTFGTGLAKPVYRVRCPMAFDNRGASWLQESEQTENPYFGAAMYRCGARTATYEPGPALRDQTTCPIMGKPIVRDVFTDHDGMRIYFCCPPCIEKFLADPARHLAAMRAAGERPVPVPEK